MVRLRTVAALVGVLDGLWAVGGAYFDGVGNAGCTPGGCGPSPFLIGLGALVLLSSVVCFFGPKLVFYSTAILSILLFGLILGSSNLNDLGADGALVLTALAFVTSVLATRRSTEVSEQANPMNLPVFG
jgi:hypothetical protein